MPQPTLARCGVFIAGISTVACPTGRLDQVPAPSNRRPEIVDADAVPLEDPVDLVATPGGAVVVWSSSYWSDSGDEITSEVFWQRLDASGARHGRLRRWRQSGEIRRLRLARTGDLTAVVSCSIMPEEPTKVSYAGLWLDGEGRQVGDVVTFGVHEYLVTPFDECSVNVLADGDAVLVAYSGGLQACEQREEEEEEEHEECNTIIAIDRLRPGEAPALIHRELAVAPFGISAPVRTSRGIVVAIADEHIYYKTNLLLTAAHPGQTVGQDAGFCLSGGPNLRGCTDGYRGSGVLTTELPHMVVGAVAWTGDTLVAAESIGGRLAAWRGGPIGLDPRGNRVAGEAWWWPTLRSVNITCSGGHIRAVLTADNDVSVTLDPAAPGASFHWRDVVGWTDETNGGEHQQRRAYDERRDSPLAVAWTGESLLVVGRSGEGSVEIRAMPCSDTAHVRSAPGDASSNRNATPQRFPPAAIQRAAHLAFAHAGSAGAPAAP